MITTSVREFSGGPTSNKFQFQKHWALCKLLELHKVKTDYLIIFEYHDDVVVLDSEVAPVHAEFFQIKGKISGNWTIGELTKQEKKKKEKNGLSILEKLYEHEGMCGPMAKSLVFVSNQGLSCTLSNLEKGLSFSEIQFDQLSKDDQSTIFRCVNGDDEKNWDKVGLSKFQFSRTDLSLEGHKDQTVGKLVHFLDRQFPGKDIPVTATYDSIISEFVRKTDRQFQPNSFDELKLKMGFGCTEFNAILEVVGSRSKGIDLWEDIRQIVIREGLSMPNFAKLRSAFSTYLVEKMDYSNESFHAMEKHIQTEISSLISGNSNITLSEIWDTILLNPKTSVYESLFGEHIIKASTSFNVLHHEPIQKTDSKPEDEAK